jgi:hypothetical protein
MIPAPQWLEPQAPSSSRDYERLKFDPEYSLTLSAEILQSPGALSLLRDPSRVRRIGRDAGILYSLRIRGTARGSEAHSRNCEMLSTDRHAGRSETRTAPPPDPQASWPAPAGAPALPRTLAACTRSRVSLSALGVIPINGCPRALPLLQQRRSTPAFSTRTVSGRQRSTAAFTSRRRSGYSSRLRTTSRRVIGALPIEPRRAD